MPTFGERLKSLRTSKKLTQRQLALELRVTDRTYQYYEVNRTSPPLHTLFTLADFFHVSLDYLTGRSDSPEITGFGYIRISDNLKQELEKTAKDEMRTLENLVEYLLQKGLKP
ncbi:transcriptional regulator [Synergistales bacterium]|nr:transcriptional regulator [Synergistales bacterium]